MASLLKDKIIMKFSKKTKLIKTSPIRKLSGDAQIIKKQGIKVYHLNIGQPDLKISKSFFDAINNHKIENLAYTESEGISELKNAISEYYKFYSLDFASEDILITDGASEAILFSLLVTCDNNDNILVPEPFYSNYLNFAKIAGVQIKGIPSNKNYSLSSYDIISQMIDSNTRAILLSNPSNPTGHIYTKQELNIIKQIAIDYDLWIITDEAYRDFIYNDSEFISLASFKDIKDRVILIDSASKRFSACGARIGNIASKNKEFISEVLKLCQSRLCLPLLEQIGVTELYKCHPSSLDKSRLEYKKRRDLLYDELAYDPNFLCSKPEGAFYMIVKVPDVNTEKFAKWLINDFSYNNETVLISPAKDFYITEGLGLDEIRLSYVLNIEDLKKACDILKRGIREYKK